MKPDEKYYFWNMNILEVVTDTEKNVQKENFSGENVR